MKLLFAFLLLQAVPTGVVTGVVSGPDGKPAPGVRVYAMALRDAGEPADATVLESLTETDASGRYRLDVAPGRYYIASGSVDAPTFYPDTTNRAAARPVTIASGARIDDVNFSSYLAPRPPAGFASGIAFFNATFGIQTPAPVLATLSGTVRLPDGAPAHGMDVFAVALPGAASPFIGPTSTVALRARADETGRYRLANVAPRNYYIVSGTPDFISFYAGATEIGKATPVTVSTRDLGNLDFTVSGVVIRGRVLAAGNLPVIGASIRASRTSVPGKVADISGFLADRYVWETRVESADGSFSIPGLSAGRYVVEVSAESAPSQTKDIVVGREAINGIDFTLPVVLLSGAIVLDDGSAVPDPARLGSIIFSSEGNDDDVSTIFRISSTGAFGGILDPGKYRVDLPSLPWDYSVISITSGGRDLLKEPFTMTASEPRRIEVRLERLQGK
jgi:Carboxypeptidase regulatory-like domain